MSEKIKCDGCKHKILSGQGIRCAVSDLLVKVVDECNNYEKAEPVANLPKVEIDEDLLANIISGNIKSCVIRNEEAICPKACTYCKDLAHVLAKGNIANFFRVAEPVDCIPMADEGKPIEVDLICPKHGKQESGITVAYYPDMNDETIRFASKSFCGRCFIEKFNELFGSCELKEQPAPEKKKRRGYVNTI